MQAMLDNVVQGNVVDAKLSYPTSLEARRAPTWRDLHTVKSIGDVALDLLRDGRRLQLTVKVAASADADDSAAPGPAQLAGASLGEIPPDHPAYGQIDGVLVTGVARGSPAAAGGLRRGDVIVALDGQTVESVEQVTEFQPRGRRLTVDLLRGARELRLTMG